MRYKSCPFCFDRVTSMLLRSEWEIIQKWDLFTVKVSSLSSSSISHSLWSTNDRFYELIRGCVGVLSWGRNKKNVKCCNSEMMWWAVCWPTPLTLTPNAFLLPLLPHNPSRESRCPLLFRPWHNRGMVPLSQNNMLCGFLWATVASRQCWSVR